MALISTGVLPSVDVQRFLSPATQSGSVSGIPIGRAIVSDNFSTTGTGGADTEQVSIQIDLPENYFYRILSLGITLYSGTSFDSNAWDNRPWIVQLQTNLDATYYDTLAPKNIQGFGSSTETRSQYYGGASNFMVSWAPEGQNLLGQLIDGRNSGNIAVPPRITIQNYSSVASASSVLMNVYMTALQYTIDEGLSWPIWSTGNLLTD